MKIFIERLFRCRIAFDINSDDNGNEKVLNKAFTLKQNDLEITTYEGCPACSPYVTIEGESKQEVTEFAEKLVRYIKRFKEYTID